MITIDQHELTSKNPYIIAEIGSNWETLDDCLNGVRMAKVCGAHAAKFQLLDHAAMYGDFAKKGKKGELPLDWLQQIHDVCKDVGIHLVMSVFSPDAVRQIDPYVPCHKIASRVLTHKDLLNTVAATGKPIFLSTGGASESEIHLALAELEGANVILNYCVASYPSDSNNLFILDKLARLGYPVGFSDHSLDYKYLPRAACKFHGAVAIEKHFIPKPMATADAGHSLNPAKFRAMVDYISGKRSDIIGPVEAEAEFLMKHKVRLVAMSNIKQGDMLNYGENFGPYSSTMPETDYITPFATKMVDNKPAKKAIQQKRAITLLDV